MAKKEEIQIEFELHCSPRILFNYLHTPSGLSEWFADDVTYTDGIYTFKWTESESRAKIVHKRDNKLVRFKWLDEGEDDFFEFKIVTDDLTSDVALIITDFADPDNQDEVELLWETQIQELKQIIGA